MVGCGVGGGAERIRVYFITIKIVKTILMYRENKDIPLFMPDYFAPLKYSYGFRRI